MKLNVFTAFIAILICCTFKAAQAASFDCKIASSELEKIICCDKELSDLDSSLGKLYASRKKTNPNLVGEQKRWLIENRNVCQTNACLIKVYKNRIKELQESDGCQITENSLVGGWVEYKIPGD